MAKQITVPFNGSTYTLEYTRKSVEAMERQGFDIGKLFEMPAVMIPMLVRGAFRANHPSIKAKVSDDVFAAIPNKQEFLGKLIEMYNEPIEAMLSDPEGDAGNVNWEASW